MPPAQCIDNALHHNIGPNIPIDVLIKPKIDFDFNQQKFNYIGVSIDVSF